VWRAGWPAIACQRGYTCARLSGVRWPGDAAPRQPRARRSGRTPPATCEGSVHGTYRDAGSHHPGTYHVLVDTEVSGQIALSQARACARARQQVENLPPPDLIRGGGATAGNKTSLALLGCACKMRLAGEALQPGVRRPRNGKSSACTCSRWHHHHMSQAYRQCHSILRRGW